MLHREAVLPSTLELLEKIMDKPALSEFYLVGGTSLALQIGHRHSTDLDLFGQRPFEVSELLSELSDFSPLSIMNQRKNILILNIQGVKVDFVNYQYLPVVSPILIEGIRLLALPDIGAMKLAAIAGRGRKRDFFDLYFLLQKYSLSELMRFYLKKYPDGSEFMVVRSLTYFEDADQDEEIKLLDKITDWEMVKRFVLAKVKNQYF